MKAQASLRICPDSPEPSMLVYTKYGCIWRLGQKLKLYPTSLRQYGSLFEAFAYMRPATALPILTA